MNAGGKCFYKKEKRIIAPPSGTSHQAAGAAEEPHKETCARTLERRKKRGVSGGAGARHKDTCPRTHSKKNKRKEEEEEEE
jgi:ribosome modulation factor